MELFRTYREQAFYDDNNNINRTETGSLQVQSRFPYVKICFRKVHSCRFDPSAEMHLPYTLPVSGNLLSCQASGPVGLPQGRTEVRFSRAGTAAAREPTTPCCCTPSFFVLFRYHIFCVLSTDNIVGFLFLNSGVDSFVK